MYLSNGRFKPVHAGEFWRIMMLKRFLNLSYRLRVMFLILVTLPAEDRFSQYFRHLSITTRWYHCLVHTGKGVDIVLNPNPY